MIITIEKKIGINSLSGGKKWGKNSGREKESRGKIYSLFPDVFPPIRYYRLGRKSLVTICSYLITLYFSSSRNFLT